MTFEIDLNRGLFPVERPGISGIAIALSRSGDLHTGSICNGLIVLGITDSARGSIGGVQRASGDHFFDGDGDAGSVDHVSAGSAFEAGIDFQESAVGRLGAGVRRARVGEENETDRAVLADSVGGVVGTVGHQRVGKHTAGTAKVVVGQAESADVASGSGFLAVGDTGGTVGGKGPIGLALQALGGSGVEAAAGERGGGVHASSVGEDESFVAESAGGGAGVDAAAGDSTGASDASSGGDEIGGGAVEALVGRSPLFAVSDGRRSDTGSTGKVEVGIADGAAEQVDRKLAVGGSRGKAGVSGENSALSALSASGG